VSERTASDRTASEPTAPEPIAATMLVVIAPGQLTATQSFPNPLTLKPGVQCAWHCNSPSADHDKSGGFMVVFDDASLFGVTEISAPIGGTTQKLIVQPDAAPGTHRYTISVLGISHDPEIIIEEAVPTEPEQKARAAGTGR
jgi:hypothetical protein